MIVGEAPGYQESRDGVPFVGKAGKLLDTMLTQAGFKREEIYVTNAIKCRPPDNRDPTAAELKACRSYLRAEIDAVSPRVIIAFGNHALRTLTGASGITKNRGEMLGLSSHFSDAAISDNRLVFPTIHPAAGTRYPSNRRHTEEDLALLRRLIDDDFTEIPIVWDEPARLHLRETPVWGVDLETNGRETRDPFCGIYCCAIDDGGEVVQVTTNIAMAVGVLSAAQGDFYNMNISRPLIKLVGHNASGFDRLHLRRAVGANIRFDDTMLMGFLLHEEWGPAKRLNLEALCAADLGVRPWKKRVTWKWQDEANIPQDAMKEYCAIDTRYTRQLFLKYEPQLKEQGLWNLYDRLYLPASRALSDMEERGLFIVAANVAAARAYWEAQAADQLGTLAVLAAQEDMPDFNARSPQQVAELLFERMGHTPTQYTKGGKPSTAVGVIKELREMFSDPTFDALLKYRRSQKMLGTYVTKFEQEPDREGMWYPWYSLINTATGRTAGPSQQMPRPDIGPMIRRCVGAPPGKVLLQADFSQLEMRVAASKYVFDEPNLRGAFERGEDVHTLLASTITGKPIGQITKEERANAKPPNFLFLYGGEEEMYIRTLLEDQDIVKTREQATFERDAFFARWSRLPQGHARVVAELKKEKQVRSCTGALRRLPDVDADDYKIRVEAFRMAVNFVVQNPACHLALIGLVLLGAAGLDTRSFQHDAYLLWVDDNEAAVRAAAAQVRHLLERGVPQVLHDEFGLDWDVPLKVDLTVGTAWTDDDRQAWVA